ncbi:MAG TPA: hypothetical protein VFE14_16955 [Micromonosporaceae bacterium]|nr:hypothetical protein [Micromonosporaceae bacterium]
MRHRAAVRLRRTPGRLTALMAVLLALGLGAGVAGVLGVRDRAGEIDGATAHSGALAVAAQNLYRSLSDADATAASAFLSSGLEPAALRDRYQADIAGATDALAVAAGGGISDGPGAKAIADITSALPVYTGLVETARTYSRQRVPLGAAYLREASGMMRGTLLPAAKALFRAVQARLDAARGAAGGYPWLAVPLLVLTLAALGYALRYLSRRTNRVFNVGLLAAAAATLVSLVWLGVASSRAGSHLTQSRRDGSAQVNVLAEARIAALQGRSDEALTLVARGTGGGFEQDYVTVLEQLIGADGAGGLLGQARTHATDNATRNRLDSAIANARAWQAVHKNIRTLDNDGRYSEAVAAAIGSDPTSAGSVFIKLDDDLAAAIAHNTDRFNRQVSAASGALSGVAVAIALLTALLAIGVAGGMQQRIAEYR